MYLMYEPAFSLGGARSMKAIEGRIGRVFVLRLDHDDPLPQCIEEFAAEKKIRLAQVAFHGGIYRGNLVAGPRKTEDPKPVPIVLPVNEANESVASGFIAPDEDGKPVLHMHGSLGRAGKTQTGCFQKGVTVWLVGEAVINEIISESEVARVLNEKAGIQLLEILE
jgi:predicted DNA-binding protein with PD1-like motif